MQTLKQKRENLGLSQADMARLMGVHYNTWVKWERGENAITAAPLRAVAILVQIHNETPDLFELILNQYVEKEKI